MLSPEQNEHLTLLLAELEPVTKDMSDRSRTFVTEQIQRHGQYQERMFLSPKQLSWLHSLYEEHVGPLDKLGGTPGTNKPEDDIDDEIPF